MTIRIGARGSRLARTQAAEVAAELERRGHPSVVLPIETAGDRAPLAPFGSIGPQGVFVREIEESLLAGRIDVAVHSYKDLPTGSPAGLVIAAVPERRDPADVLVMKREVFRPGTPALPVAAKARLGTASARRRAWLRDMRPDIETVHVRGNVPTRIGKIGPELDGVVLAAAGIERLRESTLAPAEDPVPPGLIVERLPPEHFVPAPAQGALGIQSRSDDRMIRDLVGALDHPPSHERVEAERTLLARIEGGCETAFGAFCGESGGTLRMVAAWERSGTVFRIAAEGPTGAATVDAAWREFTSRWIRE